MSYLTILSRVKTILESVSNIGIVHDFPRFTADLSVQHERFVSNGILHTWMIERKSFEPTTKGVMSQVFRKHVFEIVGFYEVNDANVTEKTFQNLIDDICDPIS